MKQLIYAAALWFAGGAARLAAQLGEEETAASLVAAAQTTADTTSWRYLAAALAVGLACIGSGIAIGRIGAAAMGAMAEKPELASKAIPYVGLAEGICLWGFLVAVIILFI